MKYVPRDPRCRPAAFPAPRPLMNPLYSEIGVVPPGDPPDYYRFLGVARYEPDAAAVHEAAVRLHDLIRRTQLRFPVESQKLLNVLGAATACLRDPGLRAKHDALLPAEPLSGSSRIVGGGLSARVHGSHASSLGEVELSGGSWLIRGESSASVTAAVGTEWLVGSGDDCQLRVRNRWVSKRHCRIRREEHHTTIEDLASTNGTYVNEVAIDEPTPIEPTDRITLGRQLVVPWPLPPGCVGRELRVLTIGRAPECDLVLDDPSVSHVHAQLLVESGSAILLDLDSNNGIRLGGTGDKIASCEVLNHLPVFLGRVKVTGRSLLRLAEIEAPGPGAW